MKTQCLGAIGAGLACAAALAADTPAEPAGKLEFLPSGVQDVISGFRPQRLKLSEDKPGGITKSPEDLKNPLYGTLATGSGDSALSTFVILDGNDRLRVDSNGNGDLTDDAAPTWETVARDAPDGGKVTTLKTRAMVRVPTAEGPKQGCIGLYIVRGGSIQPSKRPGLSWYSDFGYQGTTRIGDKAVKTVVGDSGATGTLAVSSDPWRNPIIWLDLNGDGKYQRDEMAVPTRAFELDGKWWQVSGIGAGPALVVAPSEKTAPARKKPAGPDLSPGKTAPSFTGKTVDGKKVNFPGDFKGKVVLLDFWATWCGPCVAEAPNVVEANRKFGDQGLAVLGISLDRENMKEKIKALCQAKGMTWPQVYGGGHWKAAVARLYGISSIPHMILVDGDTGTIIRDRDIRGPALAKAIEAALAARKQAKP